MKIHAIRLSKEMLQSIFANGIKQYKVSNGLSEDAELIGLGRISMSNDYELIFEAESGVEVEDGQAIQYNNPIFTDISKDLIWCDICNQKTQHKEGCCVRCLFS